MVILQNAFPSGGTFPFIATPSVLSVVMAQCPILSFLWETIAN